MGKWRLAKAQHHGTPQLGGRGQGEVVQLHRAPKPRRRPRARPPRLPSGGGGGGQRAIDGHGCPQTHRTLCSLPWGSLQLLQSLSPAGVSPPHGSDLSPRAEEALGALSLNAISPGYPVAPAPSLRVIRPPSTPPAHSVRASISAPPASLGPARENTVVSFYSCPAIIFSQLRITLAKPSGCLYCFKQGFPFSPAPANSSCASCYAGAGHLPLQKSITLPCPVLPPAWEALRSPTPGFASTTTAGREPLEGTAGSSGLRRAGMCSRDLPFSTLGPAAGSQRGRKRVT